MVPTMSRDEAKQQVVAVEKAFAKSMADRDLRAFASFVADDTVFFSGPTPLHGKKAVVEFWSRFYQKPDAPFSWTPEEVEVLDAGNLALSAGPVLDPKGKLIGRFSSIWRLEAPGQWRIVFDKGGEVCDCAKP
ncbi:MAG: nuclear transport factor 2 family protein [Pseudomonadota bacterium]